MAFVSCGGTAGHICPCCVPEESADVCKQTLIFNCTVCIFILLLIFFGVLFANIPAQRLAKSQGCLCLKIKCKPNLQRLIVGANCSLGEKCFVEIAEKQFHISTSQCSSLSVMFYSWNIHKEMFVYIIVFFVEFLFVTLFSFCSNNVACSREKIYKILLVNYRQWHG